MQAVGGARRGDRLWAGYQAEKPSRAFLVVGGFRTCVLRRGLRLAVLLDETPDLASDPAASFRGLIRPDRGCKQSFVHSSVNTRTHQSC